MRHKPIERICQYCQSAFLAKYSQVKIGKGTFCSKECVHQFQRKNRITRTCKYCLVNFFTQLNCIKINKGNYCSRKCSSAARITTLENFYSRIQKTDSCWLWTGAKEGGYGVFNLEKRGCRAHQLSYELIYGRILPGFIMCHRCDNPICVNPDHIFAGTISDNMQDMIAKKRHQRGISHHRAKLTESNVLEIREKYNELQEPIEKIAQRYAISRSSIRLILSRKTWKHI